MANSYWIAGSIGENAKIGYAPLLFAMGATMLSITVPRYGIVVEGPSDAILLPSIFRAVSGLATLPYRIVPGLAELAEGEKSVIEEQAGRVVCLTDGDEGGRIMKKYLSNAGIAEKMIFDLGEDVCLEDLVSRSCFTDAVNSEIETWALSEQRLEESEVPENGRWKWLKMESSRLGLPVKRLTKTRVAQRMVDWLRAGERQGEEDLFIQKNMRERVLRLHKEFMSELRIKE